MKIERLSRFIARHTEFSRRKAEEAISSGRVIVNGIPVKEVWYLINPEQDRVLIDNYEIKIQTGRLYIALNKPPGYISDLKDPKGRPLARGLIPYHDRRLYPVGRLDYNSEGLMIFTDDGDFAYKIMHPKYMIEKEYLVKLKGRLANGDMNRFIKGITINGEVYRAKSIRFIKDTIHNSWYNIVLIEGKNRMIRVLTDFIGHPVIKLKRQRIGPIRLGGLKSGSYRVLNRREVEAIFSQ